MATTATALRAKHEPIRSIRCNGITANWNPVGKPLQYPSRLIVMQNWTDEDVMISTIYSDLMVDPFYGEIALQSGSGRVLDISTNNFTTQTGGIFVYPAGTQFWIRYITNQPMNDYVYIESIYGEDLL